MRFSSDMMKPEHLKAVRMLGYTLTAGDSDHWLGLAVSLAGRLTVHERAALAFAALKSLPDDVGFDTANAALDHGAGTPGVPLFGYMGQATHWADIAEPDELAAYCLAAFNRMPEQRKTAFLEYVNGRTAA